jgi:hypothetical protein
MRNALAIYIYIERIFMIKKGKVLGFISATRPKPYLHSRSEHSWSLSKIYSPNTLEY